MIAITVTTRVTNPRATRYNVDGGIDYDAEIDVTDESGITSRWQGGLTYAPAQYDGRLGPWGQLDHWMSSGLIAALRTPWIDAHDPLTKAIIESLGGGAGEETFEVSL